MTVVISVRRWHPLLTVAVTALLCSTGTARAAGTLPHADKARANVTGEAMANGREGTRPSSPNATIKVAPQPNFGFTGRSASVSGRGRPGTLSARPAALSAGAVPLKKRCNWSRKHHGGTRTCRYYRIKKLIKTCVKRPKHRERCTLAHPAPGKKPPTGTQGVSPVVDPPVAATSPQPVTPPVSSEAERPSTGALLPTEQIDPAPEATSATLPASVDLSNYSVPVGNQGTVNSCVTWTIQYAMFGWYSRRQNRPGQPFNPMYTYSQISHQQNVGTRPQDALKVAVEQGNDTMAHYSHNTNDYWDLPNAAERANAANYKIAGWNTLFQSPTGIGNATDTAAIKAALAQGKPVAISMTVRDPLFNVRNKDASYTFDDVTSPVAGRHEVMATGYDAAGLWFQNSWGTGWGFNGYGHLSWRVVDHDVYEAETVSGFAPLQTGDTTPPVMGSVTASLYEHQITSTAVAAKFNWSATDNTGVTAYEVQVTKDNGQNWAVDPYAAANATSIARWVSFNTTYVYAVRARDAAGNWSNWALSRPVTATVLDDKAIAANSPWARYAASDAFGGTYIASSEGGEVNVSVTGTAVSWITPRFSSGGRTRVYCDGIYEGTADQYSLTTVWGQTMGWCNFSTYGSHTIRLVSEATPGRPWTAADAFVILS